MDEAVVVAEHLTKTFAQDAGVFDMNLELPSGKIIGLIGPSGSGKTTTVRLMTGILTPDRGSIRVLGSRPRDFDVDTRARIGYMPQEAILYPDLTLAENLSFAASLYGMPLRRQEEIDRLVGLLELDSAVDRVPRQASGGERRRLMLASTLVHQPDLMFLDEPTAGVDPVLRRKIWNRFEELADAGRTLIVTTQYVGEAEYCDYVAVLAEGRTLAFDTPESLRRSAYGGEVMDVAFARPPTEQQLDSLTQHISGERVEWLDARSIRIVVADAGQAGPAINKWGHDQDIELLETEAHIPSFDDVFVVLMEELSRDADMEQHSAV